ncbi:MAG: class I SAM-dependent methyltransferase [bacterium]|nr:class I SAM-dependent methyltransferase [bacterium]
MSKVPSAVCLVCGDPRSHLRYQITRFQVLECSRCDQIFLNPLPDEREIQELFAELYATGGGSVPELKSYYGYCYDDDPDNPLVQLYEQWLDRIEECHATGRLLDVGSGTGLFLAIAKRRGWEVYGIDASTEATDFARERFGLDLWVGDFADFESRELRFDVITGWDIIEHARAPVPLLETMRECLAPGGSIVLSTPDQNSILDVIAGGLYRASGGRMIAALEKFYIEQHFLYFTQASLAQAFARAGLEVTTMEAEFTDLRRLTLNPLMRGVLISMFLVARFTGLENRIFAMARAKEDRSDTHGCTDQN